MESLMRFFTGHKTKDGQNYCGVQVASFDFSHQYNRSNLGGNIWRGRRDSKCPPALSHRNLLNLCSRQAHRTHLNPRIGHVLGTCALLLSVGVASAQEQPRTFRVPHYNRKALIAEVSLLAASKTADAITTRELLDRGGHENNPIFGRHPSRAKQSFINLGFFAAESIAFYVTEHNRHTWVRWTGRVLLAHAVVEHTQLAACNAGIDTRAPRVHTLLPH